ncbi:hypothetical protein [Tsukamurella pseudospumae]|uniref:hypothetical protein n=1 Tax=Tsukamurella pseudospumae TaxID=239498 RepID=UPI000ADC4D8D|nr:hypothetical protein [Tsukamurella pseudospumae]
MTEGQRWVYTPEGQLKLAQIAAKAALLNGRKPDPRALKVLRKHSDPLADAEPA